MTRYTYREPSTVRASRGRDVLDQLREVVALIPVHQPVQVHVLDVPVAVAAVRADVVAARVRRAKGTDVSGGQLVEYVETAQARLAVRLRRLGLQPLRPRSGRGLRLWRVVLHCDPALGAVAADRVGIVHYHRGARFFPVGQPANISTCCLSD